jgi:four helix bundle protein
MGAKDYRELEVWQQAMKLVIAIYGVTDRLPRCEQFGLCDQLRRAAVSIPSNIAEGFGRDTHKDFAHFLAMSRGSLYEVGTQLEIASALGYVDSIDEVRALMNSISRMLGSLIRKLQSPAPSTRHQAPSTRHQAQTNHGD